MSNSHLFMKAAYPRAPLKNGIGRYICQLQRVTLKFCKNNGSSRGARDFIENYLIDFARRNPSVVVYLKPRRHRAPCLVAEYLNGEKHNMGLRDSSGVQINQWLHYYLKQSGYPEQRFHQMWHTDHPSIQGVWTPFTNKEPEINVDDLFDKKWSGPLHLRPTATEELIKIFQRQQMENLQLENKEEAQ